MSFRSATAAVVLALALAPRPAAQLPRGTGAILGQVVNSIDGRGVRAAIVRLTARGLTQTRIADDRGRFYFRNLPAGEFAIHATKTGFVDGAYGKRRAGGSGMPVVLASGQIVADATIELFRPATISGIVVDEGNEPVIGARVLAFRRQFVANGWRYVPAGRAVSNDRGEYRIFGLIPGEYVVSVPGGSITIPLSSLEQIGQTGRSIPAVGMLLTWNAFAGSGQALAGLLQTDPDERNARIAAPAPTPPAPSGRREFTYPTQYFPAAEVPGRATPVAIGPGDDHGGVNFRLHPVTAVRIEGIATGPGGPAAHQMLRLLMADGDDQGFGTETAATVTAADGTFEFQRVPPGRYRIEARSAVSIIVSPDGGRPTTLAGFSLVPVASPELRLLTRDFDDLPLATATPPPPDAALWGREDVTVDHDDLRGVTIELRPPIAVAGRVMFDGTGRRPAPAEIAQVQIALEPADGSAMALAPTRADESGAFTFRGMMPGQYFVQVTGAPRGWFLRSVTSRGRDVSDVPLDAYADSGADLTVAFGTRGTNILGTVRDARSQPARGATVLVFPAAIAGRTVAAGSSRQREVRASAAGGFSIDGLPPGEYFVVAIDDAEAEGWQDARALQALVSVASRISLRAGEPRSLELRITARKPR